MSTRRRVAKHLNPDHRCIWHEVHTMFLQTKANWGHGSPEEGIHPGILKALAQLSTDSEENHGLHQYTQLTGHPRLLSALEQFYSPLFGRRLDKNKEILVTCGASYALYCAVVGAIDPGDEVIIVEPYYEAYSTLVEQARGKSVMVPLKPISNGPCASSADWYLDPEELERKFTSKTKMIILNNPHNPLGKVFTRSELEMIADLAKKYDVIVLMDEVYEFLVYKGSEHVRMATLPGMWERTITVCTAGKVFNVTGWRVGWAIAPHDLLQCVSVVHMECARVCITPLQEAVAVGFESEFKLLGTPDSYWTKMCATLEAKRDRVAHFLGSVGMQPNIPQGSYFIVANISELASKVDLTERGDTKDEKFFRWLNNEKGLLCVPMSAFYSKEHKHLGENYVRFCYMKKNSTLDCGEKIIQEIKSTYFK